MIDGMAHRTGKRRACRKSNIRLSIELSLLALIVGLTLRQTTEINSEWSNDADKEDVSALYNGNSTNRNNTRIEAFILLRGVHKISKNIKELDVSELLEHN